MKWLVTGLFVLATVSSSVAADLDREGPIGGSAQRDGRSVLFCTGLSLDMTPLEQRDAYYGNVFELGAGGQLSYVFFYHYGWGLTGSYFCNVRVYDWLTCTQIAVMGPFEILEASSAPQEAYVELCTYNLNITGQVFIGIEPLTCLPYPDPEYPWDCYPDLVYDNDYFSPDPPVDGCGAAVDARSVPVTCSQLIGPQGPVDFVLYVAIDECEPVAAGTVTWGSVKGLYR